MPKYLHTPRCYSLYLKQKPEKSNSRIVKSVLEAADGKAVCPAYIVHVRIATVEVQVGGVRATHSTTPIEADTTHIEERSIAGIPVASCS